MTTSTTLNIINWRELVPASVAAQADTWQGRIHQAIAASVMVTGQALRTMKPLMPHGAFEAWWRQELGLKDRKLVSDLMAASELLETQADDTPLSKLPPRTLAILQRAGSMNVLEAAVERLENGQRVTEAEARRIASDAPQASPRLSCSKAGRLMGFLNDERAKVLASYINAKKQAEARLDALEAAAKLDPTLGRMSTDEQVAESKRENGHPLAKLMMEAATEYRKAELLIYEYRNWTTENLLPPLPIDDPLWDALGEGKPQILYNVLREWAAEQAVHLKGHRDPEGSLRLWLQECWIPRDRNASHLEKLVPVALEPWEVFVKEYIAMMMNR